VLETVWAAVYWSHGQMEEQSSYAASNVAGTPATGWNAVAQSQHASESKSRFAISLELHSCPEACARARSQPADLQRQKKGRGAARAWVPRDRRRHATAAAYRAGRGEQQQRHTAAHARRRRRDEHGRGGRSRYSSRLGPAVARRQQPRERGLRRRKHRTNPNRPPPQNPQSNNGNVASGDYKCSAQCGHMA
jgi:hypothetical protein